MLFPIYRHQASKPDRYYYDALPSNNAGWSQGEVAFCAYLTPQLGAVPIYRHQASAPDRYYYDTQIDNNSGWTRGVVAFYAYETAQPGTIPIYRHQASTPDRYYYDTQIANNSGWTNGVVAFHAYPARVPIYRHQASKPDRYCYDTHAQKNSDWTDGAIAFYAHLTHEAGSIPIYMHQAPDPERYYYDTQIPNNSGWTRGVVAFYAYESAQPGTIPIYRHQASSPDRYYYDTQIANNSGWTDGVVAFYAYPAIDTAKWMSLVPDTALLSELSLPGTHESMARYGYGSICQQWTLHQQLQNGLRVFDIRLRYLPGSQNTNFSIHHGDDYQYAFLDSNFDHTSDSLFFVLDECLAFLQQNPSECVVLLMKQEKDQQKRQTFFDAFWKIIDFRGKPNDPTYLDKLFYAGHTVPHLGQIGDVNSARGKIILAFVDGDGGANYQLTAPTRGLYWGNIDFQVKWTNPQPGQVHGLDVENHWQDSMNEKWGKIETHLTSALSGGPANTIWFITYTSASHSPAIGWFPEDYANYILPKLHQYMDENLTKVPEHWSSWGAYFGTVLMDFPDHDLINLLISVSLDYKYS